MRAHPDTRKNNIPIATSNRGIFLRSTLQIPLWIGLYLYVYQTILLYLPGNYKVAGEGIIQRALSKLGWSQEALFARWGYYPISEIEVRLCPPGNTIALRPGRSALLNHIGNFHSRSDFYVLPGHRRGSYLFSALSAHGVVSRICSRNRGSDSAFPC